jgi:MFS family permease
MNYKKLNNITGWGVFAIATFVYLFTMEQTTSLWDCGEYITTANKLEVGHPPGAPFFMMLGRLFSAFASPENAAMMVNSMSALSSSFSILFLFWSITMLGRKMAKKNGELDKNSSIAILGAGLVGALSYTFTDSFWFSAVEGEVYAMSSFFTAIVFWAILKWDVEDDQYIVLEDKSTAKHPNRWILFICYMIGLSIGVHLLNLLAIPAIVFVIYFKKYEFSWKSFLIAGITSLVVLGAIQSVIIPTTVSLADWVERLFIDSFGLPFNSGAFFFLGALTLLIVFGLKWSSNKGKALLNTGILSLALVLMGYSSFVMILVRSNANPPLDENNPETLSQLHSYLKREQYGTWPILSGRFWNSPAFSDCSEDHLGPDKSSFMKVYTLTTLGSAQEVSKSDTAVIKELIKPLNLHIRFFKGKSNKQYRYSLIEKELSFVNEWDLNEFRNQCDSINKEFNSFQLPNILSFESTVKKGYIDNLKGKKGDKLFLAEYTTLFPRMYRQGEGDKYKVWCGYEGNTNKPLPAMGQINKMLQQNYTDRFQQYQALMTYANNASAPDKQRQYLRGIATDLSKDGLFLPSFSENIQFLFQYQLNWMYLRYFLWNFSGRQNDVQGYGLTGGSSKILEGNWLSGIDFIDNQRLGPQETLSDDIKLNKGYNRYFMLPLILGLIGFFFHLVKHPKGWFVVFLLFLLTGIAIVIYLNQKPAEPRERDYAYAASFYAFSFWIGIGVWALFDLGSSFINSHSRNIKRSLNTDDVPSFWLNVSSFLVPIVGLIIYLSKIDKEPAKAKSAGKVALWSFGINFLLLTPAFLSGDFVMISILLYFVLVSFILTVLIYVVGRIFGVRGVAFTSIAIGLIVPSILAYENWDDHDRSNRSTARDFAANYLNSCDYNAILFTNGDNDTFPLWYIQEVEGVRTDVRVANMSLLSTDWHINQMKKRAYESDPLPINMRESVYRSGSRDYVLITPNDNTKYKSNSQRLKIQKSLNKLQASLSNSGLDKNSLSSLLAQVFWIQDIADSLKKDDQDYKSNSIGAGTLELIKNGYDIKKYKNKAKSFITLAGTNNIGSQISQVLANASKTISKWPERWYSAQEAIDFISDDRNKKFQSFSCNNESFLNFNNIYLEVNEENAIKNGIIDSADLKKPNYRSVLKWALKGSMLYKADLAVLSLLANYQWERPIYFASIMGMQANRYLQKHMYCEGLTYKLSPVEYGGNGGTNIDKMVQLFKGEYALKKRNNEIDSIEFLWGNMKEKGVLVDYYTMRMVQNIRLQMMKLSDQLIAENRYDEAVEVLDLCFEEMPIENEQVPADDICYYLCSNYFEAGDTLKGNEIGKKLAELQLQRLNHFASMDKEHLSYVWSELGKAMFNVEMLREASLVDIDRNKMFEPDNDNMSGSVSFAYKGVLANTDYDNICAKIKDVFVDNYREKSAFFSNQQKFPVYYTQLWGGSMK